MPSIKHAVAAAAVTMVMSTGASAQAFLGGAVGQGRVDTDLVDDRGTGGKVFGGYRFSTGVAVEATYFYYGKLTDPAGVSLPEGVSLEGTGLGLGLAYSAELNRVIGAVRAGWAENKVKLGGPLGSDSDRDGKPYLGVSLGYRVTPHISIDAAADFTKFDSEKIRLITLGATFWF